MKKIISKTHFMIRLSVMEAKSIYLTSTWVNLSGVWHPCSLLTDCVCFVLNANYWWIWVPTNHHMINRPNTVPKCRHVCMAVFFFSSAYYHHSSGRVCLSLLGTWEGQQGEQWNETASTVLQVSPNIVLLIRFYV